MIYESPHNNEMNVLKHEAASTTSIWDKKQND